MKVRLADRLALMIALLFVVGCSPSHPPTYRVEGIVTAQGAPLPRATVIFESIQGTDLRDRHTARAVADDEGRYVLSTFGDQDGAVAGPYQVAVFPHFGRVSDDPAEISKTKPFPAKYLDPATSGIVFEIRPETNHLPINLSDL